MTEQRLFREQGKRLRDFRESLDLTQDKFVENIARGRTRYIDWEKGRKLVPDDILKVFQNVYGLNPDWYKTGQGPYDILAVLLLFGLVGFLIWKYAYIGNN